MHDDTDAMNEANVPDLVRRVPVADLRPGAPVVVCVRERERERRESL